ncbi:MAG: VOC family protein [Actinobacteria bacterium]|nr:VOC family protein [Actinomycetota bacterium]
MLELDHVVWAVPSIRDTADGLLAHHGLRALASGVHPAWGTRNAVVPLNGPYLELVEVADPDAPRVGFTARVAAVAEAGGGLAMWCERVDDIVAEAAVRGYDVVPGTRENDDGSLLSWRVAGIAQASAMPVLPFLIQWDDPATMPGAITVGHPCGAIERVHLDMGPDGPQHLRVTSARGEMTLP